MFNRPSTVSQDKLKSRFYKNLSTALEETSNWYNYAAVLVYIPSVFSNVISLPDVLLKFKD